MRFSTFSTGFSTTKGYQPYTHRNSGRSFLVSFGQKCGHSAFYKKEAFTGSDRGIRFWIGKVTVGEEEEAQDYQRVTVWPEPYAWKHTPDEQKISKDFAFSEEGLDEIYEWLLGDGRKLIMEI